MKQLEEDLQGVEGVSGIHHLHVWALSTTENAMTVHAVIKDPGMLDAVISGIREAASRSGIHHSTVEAETDHCPCPDKSIIPNE